MPRKKSTRMETSRPKGEEIKIKKVEKKISSDEVVEDLCKKVRDLTYGQCMVLKRSLDQRIASTRPRRK